MLSIITEAIAVFDLSKGFCCVKNLVRLVIKLSEANIDVSAATALLDQLASNEKELVVSRFFF